MLLNEATQYVGRTCSIRWRDSSGCERQIQSLIYDAADVPIYGAYIVTETEDILLGAILSISAASEGAEADCGVRSACFAKIAA